MSNLYRSPLFDRIREYFAGCPEDETIFLFVPYVRTGVLARLLEGIRNRVVLVTTWEPGDILSGSSELALYPFCRERGIALYVSQNMHLKVYSAGLADAILATGNVSRRGLMPGGNYEAATMIERLTNEDRLFFESIRNEARLVDDAMYDALKEWADTNKAGKPEEIRLDDIVPAPRSDDFSTASLPMTRSIGDLVAGYGRISRGEEPSEDAEVAGCIFHDLANYGMETDLSEGEFLQKLAARFFAHPFIRRIDGFIDPEAYFGRIKEWIQDSCTDVPVPSRRELTGNVQVLLEWFEALGDGRYKVDRPSHSQRIRKSQ